MASPLETILKNARIEYHMWQPDAGTYEILLMSRSGKGIVDVKVTRDESQGWQVHSEVAEWLVDEILQALGSTRDSRQEPRSSKKRPKQTAKKNQAAKKVVKKPAKKKVQAKTAAKVRRSRDE